MSIRAYDNSVTQGYYVDPAANAAFTQAPEQPLMDEAGRASAMSNQIHSLVDDLEDRLFGAQPRPVQGGIGLGEKSRPALAETVRETRQRLDSATDRLQSILTRL